MRVARNKKVTSRFNALLSIDDNAAVKTRGTDLA
jgi:hypothetical protein